MGGGGGRGSRRSGQEDIGCREVSDLLLENATLGADMECTGCLSTHTLQDWEEGAVSVVSPTETALRPRSFCSAMKAVPAPDKEH